MVSATLIGTVGGVILVAGAALPEKGGEVPYRSLKNWLFAVGGVCTLTYSIMNFLSGGSVFFVMLQALVNVSSVFMMTGLDERIGTPIIGLGAVGLILWSLKILPGLTTVLFVIGLAGIAMGYCAKGGTVHREMALAIGSALITVFSYLVKDRVFFWLNLFFTAFAVVQVYLLKKQRSRGIVPR